MDWRTNPWVGVGAVVLLVLGIMGIFYFQGGGSKGSSGKAPWKTFQCESTGERFDITTGEIENDKTFFMYADGAPKAYPCRICGGEDAYRVYYCPKCEKWYKYESMMQEDAPGIMCPEGHVIPEENR
ncbi:MAG: hypothetical protein J7M19_05870 [Planctomycetes bacterium]|nr:hypothetical protein [Planctomycetota bacterium]